VNRDAACWLASAGVLQQLPQSLPRPAKGVMHVVVSRIECAIEMQGCTASCDQHTNVKRRLSAAACSHCGCETVSLEASVLPHSAMFEARVQGNLHHVRRHRDHNALDSAQDIRDSCQHAALMTARQPISAPTLTGSASRRLMCNAPFLADAAACLPRWPECGCTPWTRPNTSHQH
jgi:hypothetical protein